jgi:hypothetical protein
MNRLIYTGIAAAMLFAGSMFTSANAMPVTPQTSIAQTEASTLAPTEVQYRYRERREFREFRPRYRPYVRQRFDRGNHYGWERGRGNPHRSNRWR